MSTSSLALLMSAYPSSPEDSDSSTLPSSSKAPLPRTDSSSSLPAQESSSQCSEIPVKEEILEYTDGEGSYFYVPPEEVEGSDQEGPTYLPEQEFTSLDRSITGATLWNMEDSHFASLLHNLGLIRRDAAAAISALPSIHKHKLSVLLKSWSPQKAFTDCLIEFTDCDHHYGPVGYDTVLVTDPIMSAKYDVIKDGLNQLEVERKQLDEFYNFTEEKSFFFEKCKVCGNMYANSLGLRQHVAHMHPNVNIEELLKKEEGLFPCLKCRRSFNSQAQLKKHFQKAHLPRGGGELNFKCSHCGEHFKTRVLLHRHTSDKHRNRNKAEAAELHEPWSCEICKNVFYKKGNFLKHMQKVHGKMKVSERLLNSAKLSAQLNLQAIEEEKQAARELEKAENPSPRTRRERRKPASKPKVEPEQPTPSPRKSRSGRHAPRRLIVEDSPPPTPPPPKPAPSLPAPSPPSSKEVNVTCLFCKLSFASYTDLQLHCSEVHRHGNKILLLKMFTIIDGGGGSDENTYQCILCSGVSNTPPMALSHLQTAHIDTPPDEGASSSQLEELGGGDQDASSSPVDLFDGPTCRFCHKTFKNVKIKRKHEKTVHKDQSIVCLYCFIPIVNRTELTKHIKREHSGSKSLFKCRWCDEHFPSIPKRCSHMKEQHSNQVAQIKQQPLSPAAQTPSTSSSSTCEESETQQEGSECTCVFCFSSFSTKDGLVQHIALYHSKTPKRPYKCKWCEITFETLYQRSVHMKESHDIGDQKAKTPEQHALTGLWSNPKSAPELVRVCRLCNGEVTSMVLKRHLIEHRELDHFVCLFCDKTVPSIGGIKSHILRNHPFITSRQVEKSGLVGVVDIERMANIERAHATASDLHTPSARRVNLSGPLEPPPPRITADSDIVFPCTVCFEVLSVVDHVTKEHWQDHHDTSNHGNVSNGNTTSNGNHGNGDGTSWGCTICEQRFTDRATFTFHMTHHASDSVTFAQSHVDIQNTCGYCSLTVETQQSLEGHLLIHRAVGHFNCIFCRAKSGSLEIMKQHISQAHLDGEALANDPSRHLNETPFNSSIFKCSICLKMCNNQFNLNSHTKAHILGGKPCQLCNYKFRDMGTLKNHLTLVHGASDDYITALDAGATSRCDAVPDYCELCDRTFSSQGRFQKHRKACRESFLKQDHQSPVLLSLLDTPDRSRENSGAQEEEEEEEEEDLEFLPANLPIKSDPSSTPPSSSESPHSYNTRKRPRSRITADSDIVFPCTVCFEVLSVVDHVTKEHWQDHHDTSNHGNVSNGNTTSNGNHGNGDGTSWGCTICEQRFTDRATFTFHMTHHASDSVTFAQSHVDIQNTCGYCSLTVETQQSLEGHLLIHRAVGHFNCIFCRAKSGSLEIMKQHISQAHLDGEALANDPSRHLNETPFNSSIFKCSICLKMCNNQFNLNSHTKAHILGGKPCQLCNYKFRDMGTLKNHLTLVHGASDDYITALDAGATSRCDAVPDYCELCDRTFSSQGRFQKHRKACRESFLKQDHQSPVLLSLLDTPDRSRENSGAQEEEEEEEEEDLEFLPANLPIKSDPSSTPPSSSESPHSYNTRKRPRSYTNIIPAKLLTVSYADYARQSYSAAKRMSSPLKKPDSSDLAKVTSTVSALTGTPSMVASDVGTTMSCEVCDLNFSSHKQLYWHRHTKRHLAMEIQARGPSAVSRGKHMCDLCDHGYNCKKQLHWHKKITHGPQPQQTLAPKPPSMVSDHPLVYNTPPKPIEMKPSAPPLAAAGESPSKIDSQLWWKNVTNPGGARGSEVAVPVKVSVCLGNKDEKFDEGAEQGDNVMGESSSGCQNGNGRNEPEIKSEIQATENIEPETIPSSPSNHEADGKTVDTPSSAKPTKSFICELCQVDFKSNKQLYNHKRTLAHIQLSKKLDPTHTDVFYTCEECQLDFQSYKQLWNHRHSLQHWELSQRLKQQRGEGAGEGGGEIGGSSAGEGDNGSIGAGADRKGDSSEADKNGDGAVEGGTAVDIKGGSTVAEEEGGNTAVTTRSSSTKEQPPAPTEESCNYVCLDCDCVFTHQTQMKQHRTNYSHQIITIVTAPWQKPSASSSPKEKQLPPPPPPPPRVPAKCSKGMICSDKIPCRYHQPKKPTPEKHAPYHCEKCNLPFTALRAYTVHCKQHLEEGFKCKLCKQKFQFRNYNNVKRHLTKIHKVTSEKAKDYLETFHSYNQNQSEDENCVEKLLEDAGLTLDRVEEHKNWVTTVDCKYCRISFECVGDMLVHVTSEHDSTYHLSYLQRFLGDEGSCSDGSVDDHSLSDAELDGESTVPLIRIKRPLVGGDGSSGKKPKFGSKLITPAAGDNSVVGEEGESTVGTKRQYVCILCNHGFTVYLAWWYHSKREHDFSNVSYYGGTPDSKLPGKSYESSCKKNVRAECPECRAIFSQRLLLEEHLAVHKKPKCFRCDFCCKRFNSCKNASRHRLKCHTVVTYGRKWWVCRECDGVQFPRAEDLIDHVQENHYTGGKGQDNAAVTFCCPTCGKGRVPAKCSKGMICSDKIPCRYHQPKKPTPEKHAPYHCEKCNLPFTALRAYTVHCKQHLEEGFKCKLCKQKFQFRNYNNVKRHLTKIHKVTSEKAKDYLETFHSYNQNQSEDGNCVEKLLGDAGLTLDRVEEHKNWITTVDCKYCRISFECVGDMLVHVTSEHDSTYHLSYLQRFLGDDGSCSDGSVDDHSLSDAELDGESTVPLIRIKRPLVGGGGSSGKKPKFGSKLITPAAGDNSVVGEEGESTVGTKRQYVCILCNHGFTVYLAWWYHSKREHDFSNVSYYGGTPDSKLPGKSYESSCKKNVRAECPECRAIFSQRLLLEEHLAVHKKPKCFRCDFCCKRFNSCKNASRHRLKCHTVVTYGRKWWVCRECDGVQFPRAEDLIDHVQENHYTGGEGQDNAAVTFCCPTCGKVYNKEKRGITILSRFIFEKRAAESVSRLRSQMSLIYRVFNYFMVLYFLCVNHLSLFYQPFI
eukprot:sb/3460390/